jgi:hypothetical protein
MRALPPTLQHAVRRTARLIAPAGLLAGLLATACQTAATLPIEPWAAAEMTRLTDQTPARLDHRILATDNRTIALTGGAGETLAVQVILDTADEPVTGLTIAATPLSNDAGQSVPVRLYRQLPIPVERFPPWYLRLVPDRPSPAGFYDPLVPLAEGETFDLPAKGRLALWVDLPLPRGITPSLCRGQIALRDATGRTRSVPIEATVMPYALSTARPLPCLGGFDHHQIFTTLIRRSGMVYDPKYLDLDAPEVRQAVKHIGQLIRLGRSHHVELFDKALRPKIFRDLHGRIKLNWTVFDAIAGPFLTGEAFANRQPLAAWPLPVSADWPEPANYGGIEADTYFDTARLLVERCAAHFAQAGWSQQVFAWPYRDEVSADGYLEFLQLAGMVRAGSSTLPVLSPLPPNPPAQSSFDPPDHFADAYDILAPPGRWFDPPARPNAPKAVPSSRPADKALAGVWLRPNDPPWTPSLALPATPADLRATPWLADSLHCSAVFIDDVLAWPIAPANQADARLFYPGTIANKPDTILPSARLKRLRRGMEDLQLLNILRQQNRSSLARTILHSMVRYAGRDAVGDHYLDPRITGWVQTPAVWQDATALLQHEVAAAIARRQPTQAEQIASRVRWKNFTRDTTGLTPERVQTTVRAGELPWPDVEDSGLVRSIRATIRIDLFSKYLTPVEATITPAALPPGWKAVLAEHIIPRLGPGQTRQARLVIEGVNVPPLPDGKLPAAVRVRTDAGQDETIRTDIAFLVAAPTAEPLAIDGSLADWPLRPNNTAGAFRLLGRLGQTPAGLADRQSRAFVLQDEKFLYFALQCFEPTLDKLQARTTNRPQYQQLLPVGEDLVEILLDPGADATSPGELIHIAIKANGVIVQERGIRTDPPIGPAEPTSLDITAAIGREDNAWIVEMKIPRASFGADGARPFWGVNFTRVSPQDNQASSWSGATRNFYDPRSLGTMFVLPPKKTYTEPTRNQPASNPQESNHGQ